MEFRSKITGNKDPSKYYAYTQSLLNINAQEEKWDVHGHNTPPLTINN